MRISFILVLLFANSLVPAQDSTGLETFDRGLKYYQQGKKDSAIIAWREIVENKTGKNSDVYGTAFFNIPTVYWELKDYENARKWFLKILDSDLRDSDETGSSMEPHANYKHNSALALAGFCQEDSNYSEALSWINKSDTLYPYWGFEGSATSITKKQVYLLGWKVDLYTKMGKKEHAIREIICELIYSGNLQAFFFTSEDYLFSLIKGDEKEFRTDLENALQEVSIRQIDSLNSIASFNFRGLDYKIRMSKEYPDQNIPHYWKIVFVPEEKNIDKEFIIHHITNRRFFKQLQ